MIPGEYIIKDGFITANEGRTIIKLVVVNTGDRPVQVGSHYHFFEVNNQMSFDRAASVGKRLNIAAGTAVRFEPGEEKEIELVDYGGKRDIRGFNNLTNGVTTNAEVVKAANENSSRKNFKTSGQ